MASNEEQLMVEHSRFPTLIAVAQKLDMEFDGPNVANSAVNSISESNPKVLALLRIHRSAMKHNRVRKGIRPSLQGLQSLKSELD
ncbi:hypothetical protein SESBI_18876 [Sesbania bispinosa]|nr:hypothetical protein SESBI_18876 [Sesbania bispinosa]